MYVCVCVCACIRACVCVLVFSVKDYMECSVDRLQAYRRLDCPILGHLFNMPVPPSPLLRYQSTDSHVTHMHCVLCYVGHMIVL